MYVDFNSHQGNILFEEMMHVINNSRYLQLITALRPILYKHENVYIYNYENGTIIGKGESAQLAAENFYENYNKKL